MSLRSLSLLALLLFAGACTKAKLEAQQPPGPAPVDDKLAIEGQVCTRTPRDELFPVKILFVIDTSNSMAITDRESQAARAVFQVIDRYRGNPSVKFGVIAFDSRTEALTRDETGAPGFTASPDLAAIDTRLRAPDLATDYQGALAGAYSMLFRDMSRSSPEERARSKYVVIFFSDGNPDPQCFADPSRAAEQPFVCDIPRERWPDLVNPPPGYSDADFQAFFADLEAGKDYNTDDQIIGRVQEIMELQELFQVSELRFHTGFLFDPNVMDGPFKDAFRLDRDAGIDLMKKMKDAGGGTFTEFTSGGSITFLNINYTSVKKPYRLKNLFAFNENAETLSGVLRVDSDGDGIADDQELALGMCPYDAAGPSCAYGLGVDSDGDGYSDLFEHRMRHAGFDPLVPAEVPCFAPGLDTDGDGLLDCEEEILGTRPDAFDTDGDGIPDGIEFRYGLDPLDPTDAYGDLASSGVRNIDAILANGSPLLREPSGSPLPHYRYDIREEKENPDGSVCYSFRVENVTLVTTKAATAERRGKNRIRLHFLDGPPNDPRDFGTMRTACVEARYVEPFLKKPAGGVVKLTDADFVDPLDVDREVRCVGAE
ncbi:vWA domain-containing protein [Vulgatibacter incomptus]|nr:vWA domain-containing protein [Vulgatibacter incomptus]